MDLALLMKRQLIWVIEKCAEKIKYFSKKQFIPTIRGKKFINDTKRVNFNIH